MAVGGIEARNQLTEIGEDKSPTERVSESLKRIREIIGSPSHVNLNPNLDEFDKHRDILIESASQLPRYQETLRDDANRMLGGIQIYEIILTNLKDSPKGQGVFPITDEDKRRNLLLTQKSIGSVLAKSLIAVNIEHGIEKPEDIKKF
jgi:hypothetical protein